MSESAISNAKAWLESIRDMVERLESDDEEISEQAREEIQQSALSVQVRSGWRSPGETDVEADEYEILLTTGGPALRITGDLRHDYPCDANLQWQCWGTPWTDYFEEEDITAPVMAFASVFYFGG